MTRRVTRRRSDERYDTHGVWVLIATASRGGSKLDASCGRRSGQRARKRPAGSAGHTACHFTGCRSRGIPTYVLMGVRGAQAHRAFWYWHATASST